MCNIPGIQNSKCRVSTLVAEDWKHLNQWWFSPGEGRQDDHFDGLKWRGEGCSWGASWWRESYSLIISRGAWRIHSKIGTMGPVRQTSGPSFLPLEMFRYLPLPNMDFGQLLRLTAQGKREREREKSWIPKNKDFRWGSLLINIYICTIVLQFVLVKCACHCIHAW